MTALARKPLLFLLARRLVLILSVFLLLWARPGHAGPMMPADVTVLTRDDFRGRPLFSVADALEGVSSINLEHEGSRGSRTRAKIRGGATSRGVLVLLDGIALNPDSNAQVDLAQIPLNIVERIEITRGGSSLSYSGEAVGGVIHIITSRPKEDGLVTELGTGAGRNGERNVEGRFQVRSFVGDIAYLPNRVNQSGFTFNDDYQAENHFATLSRSFGQGGFWGTEYYNHAAEVGLPQGTAVPFDQWNRRLEREPLSLTQQRTEKTQHEKISFGSPEWRGGHFYAMAMSLTRKSDERFTHDGVSFLSQDTNRSIAQLKWRKGEFEMGAQGEIEREKQYPYVSEKIHRSGAYLLNTWASDKWMVLPQLRYDDHSDIKGQPTARLALQFHPSSSFLISSNAERSFRAPAFDELFVSSGNARVAGGAEAEKAWSYDVGLNWKPGPWFHSSLTGFYSQVNDLIHTQPNSVLLTNSGREENRGVETEINVRLGEKTTFRNIELNATWTAQESHRSLAGGGSFSSTAMTPRHLVFAQLNQHLPGKLTLTNEIQYKSEQYQFDNRFGVRVPPFYVWNLRVKIKILKADLHADIENVTSRRYAEAVNTFTPVGGSVPLTSLLPLPERTYWAGITIRFDN